MKVFGSNSNFNWKNVIEGLGPLLKKGSGQVHAYTYCTELKALVPAGGSSGIPE